MVLRYKTELIGGFVMRQIVNGNEGLNIMLNEIVNHEMNKTIDEMIAAVEEWNNSSDVISCTTVIAMLKAKKAD